MQSFPKIRIVVGPTPGEEIRVTQAETIIGRDPGCDIVIQSPGVSRRHVRLYRQNQVYLIEDLGSSNGTFVNNTRLSASAVLEDGDSLKLGSTVQLVFAFPTMNSKKEPAPLAEAATERGAMDMTQSEMPAPVLGKTQVAEEKPENAPPPPQMIVSIAGSEPRIYHLVRERLLVGRGQDNDIVISSPIVSGRHMSLERGPRGYTLIPEPRATNPIYLNGAALSGNRLLEDGDVLRIGSQDPGMIVTLLYQWPAAAALKSSSREITFGEKNLVQIGRDPSNEVVLDSPLVSRFHAAVERVGQRYRVRDLKSTNGTFVNDEPIQVETWLKSGDSIRVGPFRFVLGQDRLDAYDETHGLRVEALGLNKWVRKDLNLLKDLYLVFQPREFVVVVGQSGGGKSTLVDAIAGYRPATHGQVLVNNIDIYRHFDTIRNEIGFVPQRDIIHMELTVYQALDYAARLRMPPDTSPEERHQRIMEVLADLDLTHRKDVQISGLSGGQQKRVSIGVELLTRPGLFFLDEPSSGLDPGTETALMHLMRRLADQGRTIILITHATKNVMLADKVVFLARGGYLAWFGPPDEALKFFDQYRSERDRRSRTMEFDEIYAILDDPSKGKPEDWAERYKNSAAYQDSIIRPLAALGHMVNSVAQSGSPLPVAIAAPRRSDGSRLPAAPERLRSPQPEKRRGNSALSQLAILSSRNIKILTRDRISLVLMLATAPAVAMVEVVLSIVLGRDLFSYKNGNMGNVVITLFQPAIIAVLVGALAMMREFVKESDIYRRERLVNLKVLPYVVSKFWVAALLALYQAATYTIIHYLSFKMPGGVLEFLLTYITLVLASLAGMSLGLLASAIAPNANAAPLIVILFIVPQLALGSALIPVPSSVSAITSSRWAFETLVSLSGAGSSVAKDACWDLPAAERDKLSLDQKTTLGCNCMGLNALKQSSCSFPGVGAYYTAALDQPKPVEPAAIGDPPPDPVMPPDPQLPPEPQKPANLGDQAATAAYLQNLQTYQQQVKQIQDAYRAQVQKIQDDYRVQIKAYQDRANAYKDAMTQYQKDEANWEIDRNTAVSKAEALIKRFKEDFGFAFVNKDDKRAFWLRIFSTWGVQAGIIGLLFFLILFAIYRKDKA